MTNELRFSIASKIAPSGTRIAHHDKTEFIAKLELVENPVYLRPRRFGKSMFCSLLHYYYDLNAAAQFQALFDRTWIGQNLTGQQNQFMILRFNFSSIEVGATLEGVAQPTMGSYPSNVRTVLFQCGGTYVTCTEADFRTVIINRPATGSTLTFGVAARDSNLNLSELSTLALN